MLRITLVEVGNVTQAVLEGIIDEASSFKQLLNIKSNSLQVNCRKVTRINSVGIELWNEGFSELRNRRVQLQFIEFSAVLVEANNFIAGFVAPEELKSLCVPYWCPDCKLMSMKLVTPEQVKTDLAKVEFSPCEKCKKPSEIDENPNEYFSAILLRKEK